MSNGASLKPLPGNGNFPASSLDPVAATTQPAGGSDPAAVVQLATTNGSGTSRLSGAAWMGNPVQGSLTLPESVTAGRVTIASGGELISFRTPTLTLTLLRTA